MSPLDGDCVPEAHGVRGQMLGDPDVSRARERMEQVDAAPPEISKSMLAMTASRRRRGKAAHAAWRRP
jgi:hypothetical protein